MAETDSVLEAIKVHKSRRQQWQHALKSRPLSAHWALVFRVNVKLNLYDCIVTGNSNIIVVAC